MSPADSAPRGLDDSATDAATLELAAFRLLAAGELYAAAQALRAAELASAAVRS